MPHGDANVWDEIEGIGKLGLKDWVETLDDEMQVMEFDQEEIQRMGEKAEGEEIARLKAMFALTELRPHDCGAPVPVECGCGRFICSHITDGHSPDAATFGSMLPAVLRRAGHRRQERIPDGAPAWFDVCQESQQMVHPEFGMEDDVMQPTLMKFKRDLYISLHVDDNLMVGTEEKRKEFMEFLGDRGCKCEVQGPFDIGKTFEYLKRKVDRTYEGFVIRPDPKHIEDIAKKADIKIGNYKKTPARSDLGKRDGSAELGGGDIGTQVDRGEDALHWR